MDFFNEIVDKKLQGSTKSNYKNRQKRFVNWIFKNYNEECIVNNEINLASVTATMIHTFIGEEAKYKVGSKKAGEFKSHSDVEGNHAAIINLYKLYGIAVPEDYSMVLKHSIRLKFIA